MQGTTPAITKLRSVTSHISLIDSVRPQPIKSLFPNVRKCTERGLGAETEDLWDVLLLKPNQRRIYLLRFGAGEDRVFDY